MASVTNVGGILTIGAFDVDIHGFITGDQAGIVLATCAGVSRSVDFGNLCFMSICLVLTYIVSRRRGWDWF